MIMNKKIACLIFTACTFSMSAQANEGENPKFIFPLACTYGQDCWPVNYVDVNPADKAQDFECKTKTYDGHKGSDFALGSITHMNKGVDVIAAAAGKVLRVRDGQSDHLKTEEELESLKRDKKECGNGVLIDHGNGLQTIYCHLKQDSLIVEPKQKIRAGEKIAQIGQSGMAEFPHLHFGVLWEGGIIDPYTGRINTQGCAAIKESMWHPALKMDYIPAVIFDGGFRAKSPDFEEVKRGEKHPEHININSAAFVFWAGFYNVEAGDEITVRILDPDGKVFVERTQAQEITRTRQYYYTGRKIGRVQLKAGTYKGTASLKRVQYDGENMVKAREFTVQVQD